MHSQPLDKQIVSIYVTHNCYCPSNCLERLVRQMEAIYKQEEIMKTNLATQNILQVRRKPENSCLVMKQQNYQSLKQKVSTLTEYFLINTRIYFLTGAKQGSAEFPDLGGNRSRKSFLLQV